MKAVLRKHRRGDYYYAVIRLLFRRCAHTPKRTARSRSRGRLHHLPASEGIPSFTIGGQKRHDIRKLGGRRFRPFPGVPKAAQRPVPRVPERWPPPPSPRRARAGRRSAQHPNLDRPRGPARGPPTRNPGEARGRGRGGADPGRRGGRARQGLRAGADTHHTMP